MKCLFMTDDHASWLGITSANLPECNTDFLLLVVGGYSGLCYTEITLLVVLRLTKQKT